MGESREAARAAIIVAHKYMGHFIEDGVLVACSCDRESVASPCAIFSGAETSEG